MPRKPKIAAPPGHKGCALCLKILPLKDPETYRSNFSGSYCRSCASKYAQASRQKISVGELELKRQMEPTGARLGLRDPISQGTADALMARAFIAPFPQLTLPPLVRCACCYAPPTSTVGGKQFCERCAYYVAASGRCPEHSYHEHVPELLGRPDAPLLPKREVPNVVIVHRQLPDIDELDIEPPDPPEAAQDRS